MNFLLGCILSVFLILALVLILMAKTNHHSTKGGRAYLNLNWNFDQFTLSFVAFLTLGKRVEGSNVQRGGETITTHSGEGRRQQHLRKEAKRHHSKHVPPFPPECPPSKNNSRPNGHSG